MIVSPLRVYISVSWKGDLETERKSIEELIQRDLLMFPVYPQEASIGAVPSNYFKKVNECDLVIAILGSRYSKHVNNEINYSFQNKIPVLCFVKDCKKEKKLQEMISKLEDNHITTRPFRIIEDLEKEVKGAIISLLSERFKDCVEIERSILRLITDGRIEIIKPKPFESQYIDVPRINPFERI